MSLTSRTDYCNSQWEAFMKRLDDAAIKNLTQKTYLKYLTQNSRWKMWQKILDKNARPKNGWKKESILSDSKVVLTFWQKPLHHDIFSSLSEKSVRLKKDPDSKSAKMQSVVRKII